MLIAIMNALNCLGKRWEFVWGEGSKEYSEEVIKSYICRHGLIVQRNNDNQQPTPKNLAAIHAGGSRENKNRTNRIFGAKVQRLINDGTLTPTCTR